MFAVLPPPARLPDSTLIQPQPRKLLGPNPVAVRPHAVVKVDQPISKCETSANMEWATFGRLLERQAVDSRVAGRCFRFGEQISVLFSAARRAEGWPALHHRGVRVRLGVSLPKRHICSIASLSLPAI